MAESHGQRIHVEVVVPWRSTWRSTCVNLMFDRIDKYCLLKKSPQARRQTKNRIQGEKVHSLLNVYMSSEESGEEDSMVVHCLPWRSTCVNLMFDRIDKYCL